MPIWLMIAIGLASIVAIAEMLHYVWTAAAHPEAHLRRLSQEYPTWKKVVYLGPLIIGFLVFSFGGFHLLLGWIPSDWGTTSQEDGFTPMRAAISMLLALASLSVLPIFTKHAEMRIDARMWLGTVNGVDRLIDNLHRLQEIIPELRGGNKDGSRHIAHADKQWLLDRALKLDMGVKEYARRAMEIDAEKAEASRLAQESEAKRVAQASEQFARRRAVEAALDGVAVRGGFISEIPRQVKEGWSVFDQQKVVNIWRSLDEALQDLLRVDDATVQTGKRLTELTSALLSGEGIVKQHDVRLFARYEGDLHGGVTEFIVHRAGVETPLVEQLEFETGLHGACKAFYVAHLLPTLGRFWHGKASYDYTVLTDFLPLVSWLMSVGGKDPGALARRVDRTPGLRIRNLDGTLEIAALASSSGALLDLSMVLREGRINNVRRTKVLETGIRTFY